MKYWYGNQIQTLGLLSFSGLCLASVTTPYVQWCEIRAILLCSQILRVRNSVRAQQGWLVFAPEYPRLQLGRPRRLGKTQIDDWGLGSSRGFFLSVSLGPKCLGFWAQLRLLTRAPSCFLPMTLGYSQHSDWESRGDASEQAFPENCGNPMTFSDLLLTSGPLRPVQIA